jgi:hypothetical protein
MAPLPDFQSLSPEQKEGIYQYVEEKLKPFSVRFAHRALVFGDTGLDLQPLRDISYEVYGEEYWVHRLPVQTLVIAAVCQLTEIILPCIHTCDGLFIRQLYSLPDLLEETECKEDMHLKLPFASFFFPSHS